MEDRREFREDFVGEDGHSFGEWAVGFETLADLGVLGTLVSRWWGLSGAVGREGEEGRRGGEERRGGEGGEEIRKGGNVRLRPFS